MSGTSGKSTVIGMIGWILRDAGIPPTVLGGAALVGYRPGIGLILNVSRDHGRARPDLPALARAVYTALR